MYDLALLGWQIGALVAGGWAIVLAIVALDQRRTIASLRARLARTEAERDALEAARAGDVRQLEVVRHG